MKIAMLSATIVFSISCAYSQSRVSGITAPRLHSNTPTNSERLPKPDDLTGFISEPDVGTSRPTPRSVVDPKGTIGTIQPTQGLTDLLLIGGTDSNSENPEATTSNMTNPIADRVVIHPEFATGQGNTLTDPQSIFDAMSTLQQSADPRSSLANLPASTRLDFMKLGDIKGEIFGDADDQDSISIIHPNYLEQVSNQLRDLGRQQIETSVMDNLQGQLNANEIERLTELATQRRTQLQNLLSNQDIMDYLTSMPTDQDLTGADIAQMMADIKDLSGANNITGKDMAIAFGVLGGLATGQGNPKHVKWWTKGAGALYDAFGTESVEFVYDPETGFFGWRGTGGGASEEETNTQEPTTSQPTSPQDTTSEMESSTDTEPVTEEETTPGNETPWFSDNDDDSEDDGSGNAIIAEKDVDLGLISMDLEQMADLLLLNAYSRPSISDARMQEVLAVLGWQIEAASNDILAQANQQPQVAIMTELENSQQFDLGQ